MITFEIIGERIKAKRKSLKLSQNEMVYLLCEKGLTLSRETISKIENGSRATNALEIKAIGEILGVAAEELTAENEEKNLVSLFRRRGDTLSQSTVNELEEIQDFIKGLIVQKKIDKGEVKMKKFEPDWR